MGEHDLLQILKSIWVQILAVFWVVWWSRKIDLRTIDHGERLDRHDARMTTMEGSQRATELAQARIDERLTSIQATLAKIEQALAK